MYIATCMAVQTCVILYIRITYFAVIVDIIVISVILLTSATLLPWLYPFLYFVQVCSFDKVIFSVYHMNIILRTFDDYKTRLMYTTPSMYISSLLLHQIPYEELHKSLIM